jgi:hypothetical protein
VQDGTFVQGVSGEFSDRSFPEQLPVSEKARKIGGKPQGVADVPVVPPSLSPAATLRG